MATVEVSLGRVNKITGSPIANGDGHLISEDLQRIMELRRTVVSGGKKQWIEVAAQTLGITGQDVWNSYRRATRKLKRIEREGLLARAKDDESLLGEKERNILEGRRAGLSNQQIGMKLGISRSTARRRAKRLIENDLLPIHPRDQRTLDASGTLEHTRRLDKTVGELLQGNPELRSGQIVTILAAPDKLGVRVNRGTVARSRSRLSRGLSPVELNKGDNTGGNGLVPEQEKDFIPVEGVLRLLSVSRSYWDLIKGRYSVVTERQGRRILYCLEDVEAVKRDRQTTKRGPKIETSVTVSPEDEPQESTDIFHIYDREINHTPLLTAAEERLLSARFFSAKMALRSLRQIGQVADLPRSVGLRLAEIIEAGTGKYLLEEGDEELRHRSTESTDKPQDEADIEFVRIISRHDDWITRKLGGFADIQDELVREQMIRTFAERQFQLFEEGKEAFNELVEHNLRYVRKLSLRYRGRGVPDDDLIGEGNLGLMKAAVRFDFRKGYKFSTFATWWIRQHISRAVMDTGSDIRLPVHVHEALRKLHRARERMTQELGREVAFAEAADGLGVSDQIWKSGIGARDILSLQQPLIEEDDRNLEDIIGDGTGVEKDAGLNLMRDEIGDILEQMPARTRRVIEMRYGLKGGQAMTLEQIGDYFGLSRERIRQIEMKGLKWLRHPFRSKRLRPFLDN